MSAPTTRVTDAAVVYPYPASELTAAPDYALRLNGRDVFVHDTPVGAFANFELHGRVDVEITARDAFQKLKVRPLSRGIAAQVSGSTIRFSLDAPAMLSIELDDRLRRPLFVFAEPPLENPPKAGDPAVIAFEPGKVHDAGMIELRDGQTLYIPGGAVVRGAVSATDATNVRIVGRGVLDGSKWEKHATRLVRFNACRGVTIDGVTLTNSPSWTLPLYGCDDVTIRNLRIVSGRDNDDGIDVVGSQRVRIDGVFLRTKDDCIAIKATGYHGQTAGLRDVKDVQVTRSVFWNAEWGNALEIGFETRCESISDVVFRDCDVIRCERENYYSGGVFTIHNGDRATVRNVLYDNIRVEDAQEKLIDFKVQHSHYSKDDARGQIRYVTVQDVSIVDGKLPPSIIQSFDREHTVENVTVRNLRYKGERVTSPIDMHLIAERTKNVKVE